MSESEENKITVLNSGITSSAFLSIDYSDYTKISKTDYSTSFRNNVIQSNGVWNHGSTVNSFRMTKSPFIHDVPTIECSLSFEPDYALLQQIINMIVYKRNAVIRTRIKDKDSSIDWEYNECYLQSFSFDVQENSILDVSMSLYVRTDNVHYEWSNRETNAYGYDNTIPLTAPIAYYDWSFYKSTVDDNNTESLEEIKDITDFSFNFTQQITPKFVCKGSTNIKAPAASHLLFGIPSIEIGASKLLTKAGNFDYSTTGTSKVKKSELEQTALRIKVQGNNLLKVEGVTEVEESLAFDGIVSYKTAYLVNGKISV